MTTRSCSYNYIQDFVDKNYKYIHVIYSCDAYTTRELSLKLSSIVKYMYLRYFALRSVE